MFSKMRNSNTALKTLCDVSGSQKSNMAAAKPEIPHNSDCRLDRIEIPTAIPMFLKMRNSNIAVRTLCNVSGSQKSNLMTAKPEIPHISADKWHNKNCNSFRLIFHVRAKCANILA